MKGWELKVETSKVTIVGINFKFQVNTIRPSLFLEAAFVSKDPQHLAAVLRFLSDFLPGFKHTSEHNRYYRILNDMNAPVSV